MGADSGQVQYWHGGVRGLRAGDMLRSPFERRHELTGTERRNELHSAAAGYNDDRNPHRVYFTTDRQLARGWARTKVAGGGSLYRVRPVPAAAMEPDPDYGASAFCAPRAKILAVAEKTIMMTEDEAHLACTAGYTTWFDGSPRYDAEGYFQPPPSRLAQGKTAADYRFLGKWASVLQLDGQLVFETDRGLRPLP